MSKVKIPKFVARFIEIGNKEFEKEYGGKVAPLYFIQTIDNDYQFDDDEEFHELSFKVGEWCLESENLKKVIDAVENGYEIETETEDEEPDKYVKIKGFVDGTNYLNYNKITDNFYQSTKDPVQIAKTRFKVSWLEKHWTEYLTFKKAKLLIFEGVLDDE